MIIKDLSFVTYTIDNIIEKFVFNENDIVFAWPNNNELLSKYSFTYGELTYKGMCNIFNSLFQDDDVFYDLGSGNGRLTIGVNLKYNIKSVGIEFVKSRALVANNLLEKLQVFDNSPDLSNIHLIHGDFFENNFSDGTIFYMCNTTWKHETIILIVDKIIQESQKFKYIISQVTIKHDKLIKDKIIEAPTTWKNAVRWIFYKGISDP